MPTDDIKFGIRLEVEGGRKAAGELRLPQREAERLSRTLGGAAGGLFWTWFPADWDALNRRRRRIVAH